MKRQPNSRYCFVCGRDNPIGLYLRFDEDDAGRVMARFTPRQEHQGYPGILHGGLAAAVLDETLGRVAIGRGTWMVTGKLELRFLKPVPVEEELIVVGECLKASRLAMHAHGEIRLPDGTVGVEGNGTYVKMPEAALTNWQPEAINWQVDPDET